MPTRVVNLKHEPYDVYIGRAGHGKSGIFGNPVVIGESCPECNEVHLDAGSTLDCYGKYLTDYIARNKWFREQVRALYGKRLGCFCKPGPCHGDLLLAAVAALNHEKYET